MTYNTSVSTPAVASAQPVNHTQPQPQPGTRTLKVALDVHLAQYTVAMQYDGSTPKPTQRFSPKNFLAWVEKQMAQGWRVITCYEAGPFGYVLHRQLTALGATNYVICPRNWDDQHKRVKTDRTDARAMLNALDRFVAGNPPALALVRVPTEAQERLRSESRLRQSLKGDLKMMAQRGRGLALQYGYRLKGPCSGPRLWTDLPVPAWLRELLAPLRQAALALAPLVQQQTQKIEAASTGPKPKGLGGLSQQIIEREVGDWNRFQNRRQVSSYTGMCPGENSSGPRHQQGHLTKCGNPRLRWALCETAWRLVRYQPDYHLCKKRAPRMQGASSSRRKQLIVALARGFAVDWWRLQTQQTTPQKRGLLMTG